jgi:putative transposase
VAGRLAALLKEMFQGITERYEFELGTEGVVEDHGHLFLSASPGYSPSRVVQILKTVSARRMFREFPEVKRQLWGGELWNNAFLCAVLGTR